MNTHLLERLECIQDSLMAHYRGGTGLPNAVAGNEREVFVKEFLQKVFPSHYRFTSGVITDADDRISGQMDLVVEYPFLPSFPMHAGHERVILAESVVAAIELKSDLSAQWGQLTEEAYKLGLRQ